MRIQRWLTLLLVFAAVVRFTLPTTVELDAPDGVLRHRRSPAAIAVAPTVALATVHVPTSDVPRRIPRRLLFLFGFWDETFRLPLDDCDFTSPAPPPCLRLSRVAHLLPTDVAARLSAWTSRYASWESVILDFSGAKKLAAARFPEFSATLVAAHTGVQRSDIARLLMLAAYGGIYADADTTPSSSDMNELLDSDHARSNSLFFEETVLTPEQAAAAARAHPIREGAPEARQRIANYFMASAPAAADTCAGGAALATLKLISARVGLHPTLSSDTDYDVLFTTGPDALTDTVHSLRGWSLDGSDITGTARLDAAKDIETVLRAADSGHGADCVGVVPRPIDQLYFTHGADGAWKRRT